MHISNFIGWDIGGAHLKVANINSDGKIIFVEQHATPLWKGLVTLEKAFISIIEKISIKKKLHSLTMTAELADIFKDRKEGVNSIINICHNILGKNITFYTKDYGLKKININESDFSQIASSNWHASSYYTAKLVKSGLFIDVGSTTTDIIPFYNHKICVRGSNDQTRLRFDELVYTGVIRTPIMALTSKAMFNGELQNIVNEHFATTADIYRILGYLEDSDDLMETADGKDKTISSSICRLARVLGTDSVLYNNKNHWYDLAEYFHKAQLEILTNSIKTVLNTLPNKDCKLVSAGVGSFLVKIIAEKLSLPLIEFSELFDCDKKSQHNSNVCAPAVAIAQLSRLSKIK